MRSLWRRWVRSPSLPPVEEARAHVVGRISQGLNEVAHVIDGALEIVHVRVGGVGCLLCCSSWCCSSSSSVASSSSTCSGPGASWSKVASPSDNGAEMVVVEAKGVGQPGDYSSTCDVPLCMICLVCWSALMMNSTVWRYRRQCSTANKIANSSFSYVDNPLLRGPRGLLKNAKG